MGDDEFVPSQSLKLCYLLELQTKIKQDREAIEEGTLKDMIDPAIPDWPMEEALSLAKLSLRCAKLRRKDKPDLGKELLPELNRLREIGEQSLESVFYAGNQGNSSNNSQVPVSSTSDPSMSNPDSPAEGAQP